MRQMTRIDTIRAICVWLVPILFFHLCLRPQVVLLLHYFDQNPLGLCISLLSHDLYASRASRSVWFDLTRLLAEENSDVPHQALLYSSISRFVCKVQTLSSARWYLYHPLNTKHQVQKYIGRAAKITYFYRVYIIIFLDIWGEETGLWAHRSNYISFF